MTNPWFKFYGAEYLSDPKISSLTPQERSCWITLLCLAGLSGESGVVRYLTVDALLQKSGIVWDPYEPNEYDVAKGVLDKFVRMKMITKDDEGTIQVINWEKRQETSLTNAERQARFRAKNKDSNAPRYENNAREEKNREDIVTAVAETIPHFRVEEYSTSEEDSGDSKSPRISGDKKKAYDELILWSEKERGFAFPKTTRMKQYRAFKLANENKISRERLMEKWEEMASDKFWQKAGFDWMNVLQQCLIKPI